MRVLVTGATGFTGGHLARALSVQGHTVRVLVRRSSNATHLAGAGYGIVIGDICDAETVNQAVEGVDQVYHLAAAFRTAGKPARHYRDVNVRGTRNVIAAAKRYGVERAVHCSTVGVHGHVGRIPTDETSPLNPGDIYQRT